MKRLSLLALALIVLGACGGCRRTDYRAQKIHLPGLKNQACADVVKKALQQYAAQPNLGGALVMDRVRFDFTERTMAIEFDSMKVGLKNIEHAIARAGFEADDIPADTNAAARLPAECQ